MGINSSGTTPGVAYIDTTNGNVQNIVGLPPGAFDIMSTSLDPNADILYILALTNSGRVLYTVDLNAANVVNQATVPNALHLYHLNFNCDDGQLYGLEFDINNLNNVFLVTIDPISGALTQVSPTSIPGLPDNSPSILQPQTNQYIYVSGSQLGGNRLIFQVDLTNGTLTSSQTISMQGLFRQLAYNCFTQEIFGLYHNPLINQIVLANIDENTGVLSPRTNISGINGGSATEPAIDPFRNVYVVSATDASGNDRLYQLDLITGAPVNNPLIQNGANFFQLNYDNPCTVVADFSAPNGCLGDVTPFTDNSEGIKWEWDFDDPGSGADNTSNEISPNHTFSTAGTFTVQLIVSGCNDNDTITKTIEITPAVGTQLGNDTAICNQADYLLDATLAGATYIWSDGSTNSTLLVTANGDYSVEMNVNGCVLRDTVRVDFYGLPLDLGADTSICYGANWKLEVPNQAGLTYQWNTGSQSNYTFISDSGLYVLEVQDSVCSVKDTIEVSLLNSPVFNFNEVERICVGEEIVIDASTFVGTTYNWNTGDTVEQITVDSAGMYIASAQLDSCAYSDTVWVFVDSTIMAEIDSPVYFCRGKSETFDFSDSRTANYNWSDGSTNPVRTFSEQQFLWLERTNGCGREVDEISVLEDECLCHVFVPNSFTPNGDGLNDVFTPVIDCPILLFYQLEIFDRWGNRVFETQNPLDGWEYNGEVDDLNINLFYWRINYDFFEKGGYDSNTRKGKVILLKH